MLTRARAAGLAAGDCLIVAFSGGRDSLALASALRWARDRLGIDLLLVHVDHRLRATSGEEAKRAAELAAALQLNCEIGPVAPALKARHPGVGLEEAARRERYRILFDVAAREQAEAVATAHHQDDQAETVLLHLLRGGGVHGASGMGERSASPVATVITQDISHEGGDQKPWLWRPLLSESRGAIDAYVGQLGLKPIEDPSNQADSLRRNVLRRTILPVLEAEFPGAAAALARYGHLAAADDCFLDGLTKTILDEMKTPDGRLDASRLAEQPLAMQRRVVQQWVAARTTLQGLTANRADAVLALAAERHGGRVIEIGEGWTVRLERAMLHLEPSTTGRVAGIAMGEDEPRAHGVARVLLQDEDILRRTREIARALDEEYRDDTPLLVGVLNGAVTFMTDLMRAMRIPLEIDFMAVSSYGAATQSSGVVRILKDLDQEIEGRRVVVVEDIVDSGLTLQYLLDVLQRRNPRDIRVVALLKKEKAGAIDVPVDEVGFVIPDEFVIGYGLDYAGKYRNLPYVAVLDPRVYTPE